MKKKTKNIQTLIYRAGKEESDGNLSAPQRLLPLGCRLWPITFPPFLSLKLGSLCFFVFCCMTYNKYFMQPFSEISRAVSEAPYTLQFDNHFLSFYVLFRPNSNKMNIFFLQQKFTFPLPRSIISTCGYEKKYRYSKHTKIRKLY